MRPFGEVKRHRRDTRHDVDMSRCPLKVVEEVATESCLRFSGPKSTVVGFRPDCLARLASRGSRDTLFGDNPRKTHFVAFTLFLSLFPPAVSAISALVHFVTTGIRDVKQYRDFDILSAVREEYSNDSLDLAKDRRWIVVRR